jgi:hypothetical protein
VSHWTGIVLTECPQHRAGATEIAMPTDDELKAQKEAAEKELQTLIHSAVATHMKPLQAKLEAGFKTAITAELTTFGESIKTQFAELQKSMQPPGGGAGGAGAGAGGGAAGGANGSAGDHPVTKSPEFLAMQTQVAQLLRDNESGRKALEIANEKSWTDGTINKIQTFLQGKVKPDLLDVATDRCFKSVKKHDDGSPLFKIMKSPFQGMPEEEQALPLEVGLDEWTKTKDGMRFLPPPTPTGRRGVTAPGRGTVGGAAEMPQFTGEAKTSRDKSNRAMAREAAYAQVLPNLAKT